MSSKQNPSDKQLLDAVKASPVAVAVHDKASWLGLFVDHGQINDPIGSRPHTGRAQIDRFYETFIAPNEIAFDVANDIVCGQTVVRDVTINTRMPTGLEVAVPTHIRYEMTMIKGKPRIRRLSAHWELGAMVRQTLGAGWLGLRTYAKLSVRMIACQGLGGVMGFMRGFMGVGRAGKRRAQVFLKAVADSDENTARKLLAPGAALESAAGGPVSLSELLSQAHSISWSKLMAAGQWVSASVALADRRGVIFLRMDKRGRINGVWLYMTAGEDASAPPAD